MVKRRFIRRLSSVYQIMMLSTEFMLKPRSFLLLLLLLLGLQLTPLGAVARPQDDPTAESAPDPLRS